jgi:hypothetical protein
MKQEKWYLYCNSDERKLLIHSLNTLRNNLIQEGRHTDIVDNVMEKVLIARTVKLRVKNL